MLIEGLVGVVALIAAAALPPDLYYDINVPSTRRRSISSRSTGHRQVRCDDTAGRRTTRLHAADVESPQHLDLGKVEEKVGGESLRGRTGGAVTLAVGMSVVFERRVPLDRRHRRRGC